MTIAHYGFARHLPHALRRVLFGDRERFGLDVDENDPCWREYLDHLETFYEASQRQGVGRRINEAGYRVMQWIDLSGKRVLEIGPGGFHHAAHWRGRPASFVLVDLYEHFLAAAGARLDRLGIPYEARLASRARGAALPLDDASVDVIVSFYSLEHIHPLEPFVDEVCRVLRPGGLLVGAIPAEGGLAWGLGRMLTTRRWFLRHTNANPDKIICWEHPNFAGRILDVLADRLAPRRVDFWPLRVPVIDANLLVRFVLERRA